MSTRKHVARGGSRTGWRPTSPAGWATRRRRRRSAGPASQPGEVAVEAGERRDCARATARVEPAAQRDVEAAQLVRGDHAAGPGVVEQRAQPVLLLGGGELDAREPGRERRHRRVPVGVELGEIVGGRRSVLSAATAVEQEARRHALGGAAQVAAGEQQDALAATRPRARRAGDGGRRRPAPTRNASAPSVARRSASGSSESSRTRVGNSALGQAAHEDAVEVEPETERHVAHEDAVAEATDAAEVGVELELERAPEHLDARARPRPRRARPGGRARPRPSRPPGARPRASRPRRGLRREVVAHEALGPGGELAATLAAGVDREVVDQRGDEGLQLARRGELALEVLGVRLAVGDRPLRRQLALQRCGRAARAARATARRRARSPATPADALPARRRARARPSRNTGADASRRMTSWRWKSRSGSARRPSSAAPEHALGERAHRGAVVRDAGGDELLVHEAGVRLGRAVQDRHALERHTVAHRVDDQAHHGAHLVVGVRRRDDARVAASGATAALVGVDGRPRGGPAPSRTPASARGAPVSAGDDGHRHACRRARARSRRAGGCGQLLREVDDDRAEVGEQRRAVGDGVDRGVHQVALVVPLGRRARSRAARAMRTTSAARATRARERIERGVVERRAARGRRRPARPRWRDARRPAANTPGASASTRADGGGEHRGGHRAPARAREAGRTQQLGQPVGGEERDPGDAVAAGR